MLRILYLILFMNTLVCKESIFLDHAIIGIFAINTKTSEIIFDQNSDLSLIPSSCMKLITTAAALEILGSNYSFETHLLFDGIIDENQTLLGNIYIQGGGDPLLGSDRIGGIEPQINLWIDAIKNLGIKKIRGKIIGDSSRWEKAMAIPTWQWEDLGNYYGSGASALTFHENSYDLTFKPGSAVLEKATILKTTPNIENITLYNEVTTGPIGSFDQACVYGSEFSSVQYARGTIPLGFNEFTIKAAIPDPKALIEELVKKGLQKENIEVFSETIPSNNLKTKFHTTKSPSLEKIIYWTNQDSVNLYAEHLLKKIGESLYQEGSTESGIKGVTNFLTSQKIDLSGFYMADGSGLSRKNLITPKQMVSFLAKLQDSPLFPLLYESLPLLNGNIRAKSGSMSFSKGYAGYVGDVAFAIFINNATDSSLKMKALDTFFETLSNNS